METNNSPHIMTCSFRISGMTCPHCQHRIEIKLKNTQGVRSISVNYDTGTAKVQYEAAAIDFEKITAVIEDLGYEVSEQKQSTSGCFGKVLVSPGFRQAHGQSPQSRAILRIVGVLVIILAVSALLQAFGTSAFAAAFPIAQTGMGNGIVLLIGLLTSVHCIAMCGGINLSQTIQINDEKNKGISHASLLPAILYNSGRLVSYTAVGIAVGALGSVITISGYFKGAALLLAGTFMVIMGINMLGIFPALRRITPRPPQFLTAKIEENRIGAGPLVVGTLNGFMPCGPLQAMQLYALSTGSPVRGGIAMFLFCLGTIPLMFTLGAAGSLLSGAKGKVFSRRVMQAGAVIIAAMGLVMFTNGWNSSGLPGRGLLVPAFVKAGDGSAPQVRNKAQVVNSTLLPGRYPAITVQQGIPVRWIINAPPGSINGCNNRFILREYGIIHTFKTGDNVIEFMPERSGRFYYSCWMSMIHGTITVLSPGESS